MGRKEREGVVVNCGGMIQREEWDTGGREGGEKREGGRERGRGGG